MITNQIEMMFNANKIKIKIQLRTQRKSKIIRYLALDTLLIRKAHD